MCVCVCGVNSSQNFFNGGSLNEHFTCFLLVLFFTSGHHNNELGE